MTGRRGPLIIGSGGMLGGAVEIACRQRGSAAEAIRGAHELDITDRDQVTRCLKERRPAVVINAAGYTDVDGAEREPDAADRVNRAGPEHLARAARDAGALLVHFSTEYVFDGRAQRPYRVDDPPNPLSAYGRSKLAGERAIADSGCRHLIIRTSWLYAERGRNFVRTILDLARSRPELEVVDDQVGRPTYAADLASITLELIEHGATGIVHAANDGQCSRFELARAAVGLAGLECRVRPCTTARMPRPAARPAFGVLDLSATVALVGRPRPWPDALAGCVRLLTRTAEPR